MRYIAHKLVKNLTNIDEDLLAGSKQQSNAMPRG